MKLLLLLIFLIGCSEPTVAHDWCDVSTKCEYHNKLHEKENSTEPLEVLKLCLDNASKLTSPGYRRCYTLYKQLKGKK